MRKVFYFFMLIALSASPAFAQNTYDLVYNIFQAKCISCHGNSSPSGNMNLQGSGGTATAKTQVYNNIVNQNPSNSFAAAKGNKRVYAGDPYRSFIFRKINNGLTADVSLTAGEGGHMPQTGSLTNKEKEIIRQWILFGAPATGAVTDTALISQYYNGNGIQSVTTPPAPPAAGQGFQIHLGPFFMAPATEVEYFWKYPTHLPVNTEVTTVDPRFGNFSHHFIMFKYNDTTNTKAAGLRSGSAHSLVQMVTAHQYAGTLNLPPNTAFSFEKGTILDLNTHYINYSPDKVLSADVYLNIYTQPAGTAAQIMHPALIPNTSIAIPNDGQTHTFTQPLFDPNNPSTIWIWALSSHTHQWGVDYDIYKRNLNNTKGTHLFEGSCPGGEPGCANPIYDYQHPPVRYFSPFTPIKSNEGFIHEAKYINNGPKNPVTWGETSQDEMMIMFFFYTTDTAGLQFGQPVIAGFTANPAQACAGSSVSFTNSSSANTNSWNWNFGDGTTSTLENPNHIYTTAGTYQVRLIASNGTISDTTTQSVIINPLPVANAGADKSFCAGGSVTLTASGGATYSWSPAAGLSATTGQSVTASPSSNTTYTVTVTSSNGCSASDEVFVSVNPTPVSTISGNTNFCAGASTQLTASGGGLFQWSSGHNSQTITVTPSTNTTYTVTVTNAAGCTATASTSVTVNTAPAIALSDQTVCAGNPVILDAGAGGTTYSWSNGANTQSISVTSAGNYSVTVTSAAGCTATGTANIDVSSSLTVNPGNPTICSSATALLNAGYPGSTYLWNTGDTTQMLSVSSAGTYTVTVTAAGGCTGVGTGVVTVSNPVADAGEDLEICEGESTSINATGGATYIWNTGQTSSGFTVSPSVTTAYTVTVTDGNGCTATDNLIVTVNPLPTVSAAGDTLICAFGEAQLSAAGGSAYSWSPAAGLDNPFSASPVASPQTSTIYTVTIVDQNNCEATAEVHVEVEICPGIEVKKPTSGFYIFPVINDGSFSVFFNKNMEKINVEVWDISGRRIYKTELGATQNKVIPINLSNAAAGIYHVSISNGEERFTHRIFIK